VSKLRGDDSAFSQLLGAFGSHGDPQRRAKAERLAAMKPSDARRKGATRTEQFNVRVDISTMDLARRLIEKLGARDNRKWSQADLVILAINEVAKAEQIKGAS
jgi:hypothetical protein